MSGSKAALKAINDAIRSQDFDDAITKAQNLVEKDPKSYQGYVKLKRLTFRVQNSNPSTVKYSWLSLWTRNPESTRRRMSIKRPRDSSQATLRLGKA